MISFWRGESESLIVGDQFSVTVVEITPTTIRIRIDNSANPDESRVVDIDRHDVELANDREDKRCCVDVITSA